MSAFGSRLWNKLLDTIAPIEANAHAFLSPFSWTSHLAQVHINRSRRKEKRQLLNRLGRRLVAVAQPENWLAGSLVSLMVVFGPQLLMWFGLWRLPPWIEVLFRDSPAPPNTFTIAPVLQAAWQVLAAIISLTFVIVIFLIEFAHSKTHESRAFPLFAGYTGIVLIIIFGLTTLISMGVNTLLLNNPAILQIGLPSAVGYNLLLFGLNMLLTAYLYIRTYYFINPNFYRRIFLQHNREQVKRSVQLELKRRIALNLISECCEQNGIGFQLWGPYRETKFMAIGLRDLTREIWDVVDINLSLLGIAGRRAKSLAVGAPEDRLLYTAYPSRRVSSEKPEIAYLTEKAYRRQIAEFLLRSVKVGPPSKDATTVDDTLRLNRDLIAEAIRAGRSEVVEELLDQYIETLEAFLSAAEEHDLQFSPEAAGREDGFFSDWPVISDVRKHYTGLLESALQSSEWDIIKQFVEFPLRGMGLSFRYRDHLIFQRFAALYIRLYSASRRITANLEQAQFVRNRCWRLLADFYTYQIHSELEDGDISESEIVALGNYAQYLVIILNRLIKQAIDYRDLEQFRHFAAVSRRFAKIDDVPLSIQIEDAENRLNLVTDEAERQRLQNQIIRKQSIAAQLERLSETRQLVFIGIGAWLCHLVEEGRITPSEFKEYFASVSVEFLDAQYLNLLYAKIINSADGGDRLGWHAWEHDERPESHGEVTVEPMHFNEWLGSCYVYLMFQLTPSSLEGAPKLEPSNASRQIEDSLEGYLDKFNDLDNWRFFSEGFSRDEFDQRASVLHDMHHQATVKQQAIEEEELIQQPLDKKQIDDFVAEVHEHWADAAVLRSLFTKYGNYDPRPDVKPADDLLSFGMEYIEPKGAFVRNSHVHYMNWGQNHGRGLARGEDRMLTGDLLGLPGVNVELDKLTISLKQHLDELRSTGYAPIILYGGWEIRKKIFAASEFEPSWRIQQPPDLKHADGTFDGALILQFPDAPKGVAILVDIARFGRLVQYRIDESADFPVSIAIQEITLDTAASLLDKQPELAKHPQTSVMLDREDAIRRLQQRVLVDVWERCRFEDKDLASGKVLHVSELADHATGDTEPHEIPKDTLPLKVRTPKRKQPLRRRKKASKRSKGGDANRGRFSSDDD